MPTEADLAPKDRPQEAHTVKQVQAAVKSVDTDKLKSDLQSYEKYAETLQKTVGTGKSDTVFAELKQIPAGNPVIQGNWDIFYYASCFCMNPKKTMKDEAVMKELRREMTRKPCNVCNGKMSVPCKTCKAPKEDKKAKQAPKEEKKKKGTKSVTMFGMDNSNQAESDDGKDEFKASIEGRINNYETMIKKKEKKDDGTKKGAEKVCKTCKGSGEMLCPGCVKLIREIRDNSKSLMDKEIKAQVSALRKELVVRSKEAANAAIAAEDDEEEE